MLKQLYIPPLIMGQRNIQMHVAHGCNLTCQSCSHYTNTGGGKTLSVEKAVSWMKPWSNRISPDFFVILGGEPTLNKKLCDIAVESAKLWCARIKIVSNGFFLHLHPDLPSIMREYNMCLEISLKSDSEEYNKRLEPVRELVSKWPKEVDVVWRHDYRRWLKAYHGYGPSMMPYKDNDPEKSFDICGFKICKVIHEGKLWKCPRLAFLKMHNEKFKLHSDWNPYMEYQPLEPSCDNKKMIEFFEEQAIAECGMCPANKEKMELPSPLISAKELINVENNKRMELTVLD